MKEIFYKKKKTLFPHLVSPALLLDDCAVGIARELW
jgi:hypothetical protein